MVRYCNLLRTSRIADRRNGPTLSFIRFQVFQIQLIVSGYKTYAHRQDGEDNSQP